MLFVFVYCWYEQLSTDCPWTQILYSYYMKLCVININWGEIKKTPLTYSWMLHPHACIWFICETNVKYVINLWRYSKIFGSRDTPAPLLPRSPFTTRSLNDQSDSRACDPRYFVRIRLLLDWTRVIKVQQNQQWGPFCLIELKMCDVAFRDTSCSDWWV